MGKSLRFAEAPAASQELRGAFWPGPANPTGIEAPGPVSGFVGMPRGRGSGYVVQNDALEAESV